MMHRKIGTFAFLALALGARGAWSQSVSLFPTTSTVPAGYSVVIAKPGVQGSALLAPPGAVGSAGVPYATNSSAGIVQPDSATLQVIGSSGSLSIKALTSSLISAAGGMLTSTGVACSQLPALTGDVTSSAGSCGLALATQSGLTAGNYGGAATVAGITVNSKGVVTGETNYPITPSSIGACALTGCTTAGPIVVNVNIDGASVPVTTTGVLVNGADGVATQGGQVNYGISGNYSFYRADGTASAMSAVVANEVLGALMGYGWDGAAFGVTGSVSFCSLDAFSTTDHAGALRFFATPRNSTTAKSAGIWDEDGLGLGPNTFSCSNPPRAPLDVEIAATTDTTSDTATLGSATATGTIAVGTLPATWPSYGLMMVDSELIAYTELSTTSLSITARGQYGSTGAIHSCGSSCTFDVAMVLVRNGTGLPTLIAMSNGALGIGGTAPPPTAPAGSVSMATEALPGAAPVALTSSGDTVPAGTSLRRYKPTAAVTATLTLPTAYSDGQVLYLDNISAFAITATFSPAVNGFTGGSAFSANSGIRLRWDTYTSQWDREQ